MTETEWFACENPVKLLESLRGKGSDRKLRLLACACWRADHRRRVLDLREASVTYHTGLANLLLALAACEAEVDGLPATYPGEHESWYVGQKDIWNGLRGTLEDIDVTFVKPVGLLRDIFGNPFRPVEFESRWWTADVVGIATSIYEARAFERLPILADALQDAGCDHPDILAHCQSPGPHVPGCWVVDMVLGKK